MGRQKSAERRFFVGSTRATNKYPVEINWNTDRLILLYYCAGASGKFLHGCVALSTQVEFQHKELLNRFNSVDEKFKHFKNLVSPPDGSPSKFDFGMGCNQLLDLPLDCPDYNVEMPNYPESRVAKVKEQLSTSSTLPSLTNSNNYFFIVVHDPTHLMLYKKLWPCARILQIINSTKWITHRKFPMSQRIPPHLFDMVSLIPDQYIEYIMPFDANSFFNKEMFVKQIKNIYKKLELINDFEQSYIETLFDLYTKSIDNKIKRQ